METFTLTIGNVSITYNDMSLIKVVQDASFFTATIPFPKNLLVNVNNPVSFFFKLIPTFFYDKSILFSLKLKEYIAFKYYLRKYV